MKTNGISAAELNMMPHDVLVKLYLQTLDQLNIIQAQNKELMQKIDTLQENIAVLTQRQYGRKSEKRCDENVYQISMDLPGLMALNEAEHLAEEAAPEEPEIETVVVRKTRPKGKRAADLKNVETVIEPTITIPEARLKDLYPHGFDRLADYVYTDLEYVPAKCIAHEHHFAVYAGRRGEGVYRADVPERLLKNSLLTPSLAAAVVNAKYVNAIPLTRLSDEFKRCDINISKQVFANWMINLTDRYLVHVYNAMHEQIKKSSLIHCDETPFKVIRDGKESPSSKCYMWVYHTHEMYNSPPIYLYDYQNGRSSAALESFLKGYSGILVTDGYQVYHKMAADHPDKLIVAGCWAHAKRKYSEIVKALGNGKASSAIAAEGEKRISAIYHVDNMCKGKSQEEILTHRKQSVAPLVDAYFDWVKSCLETPMDKGGNLYRALNYSLNQEQYLRRFLDNAIIPLDNNDAERSIRKFCIGKHNWHIIDSPKGATSSAILYSIAETAKANGLKPYEYIKYLLENMLLNLAEPKDTYLPELMPWSKTIPEFCRIKL